MSAHALLDEAIAEALASNDNSHEGAGMCLLHLLIREAHAGRPIQHGDVRDLLTMFGLDGSAGLVILPRKVEIEPLTYPADEIRAVLAMEDRLAAGGDP